MFLMAWGWSGCSNDVQLPASEHVTNADVRDGDASVEALKLVTDFRNDVGYPATRTMNLVADVCEKKTYTVSTGAIAARSGIQIPDSTQVDIYYVKFHQGDMPGFAFVSTDPRINRVYTFIEKGEIADTAIVKPLKWAIDEIPGIAAEDIQLYYENLDTQTSTRALISIGPLLKTEWDQGAPYNRYVPVSDKNVNDPLWLGHCPVGCVPLGVAQVIAHCKRFKGTYYGNRNIDFDALTSVPSFDRKSISKLATQAATFVHEVAMYCQVRFGDDSSSSDLKSGYQYLKDLGYTCTYEDGNKPVDLNRLYTLLNKGIPHLIAGRNGNDQGHVWVIDGVKTNLNGSYTYHCNWGFTDLHAGWTADYLRPNEHNHFGKDQRHIYITNY